MVILKQHCEKERLIHITTESCIDSIKKNGILPSEYGDLEVGDNDGFGVYAIRTLEEHTALIEDLLLYQEPLYAVYFDSPAEWYECVYENSYDDEDSIHLGYIVLPYHIEAMCIADISPI